MKDNLLPIRMSIALVALTSVLTNVAILKEFSKIEKEIAAICQGQCQFGDSDCAKHCDERHICPVTGQKN